LREEKEKGKKGSPTTNQIIIGDTRHTNRKRARRRFQKHDGMVFLDVGGVAHATLRAQEPLTCP